MNPDWSELRAGAPGELLPQAFGPEDLRRVP